MNAMDLDKLTWLEADWLSKMKAMSGTDYEDAGVYDAWTMIFRHYAVLARGGDAEALKRALFLVWYGQAEPYWLCGIKIENFDDSLIEEVLQIVNALIAENRLDEEYTWMLPWYYHIAPYYLDQRDALEGLKRVSEGEWYLYKTGCIESSFADRGQLGKYWRSIQVKYV
jgi:hypothetical protein